jgi:hypothetical protein
MPLETLLMALEKLTDDLEDLWIEKEVLKTLALNSCPQEHLDQLVHAAQLPDSALRKQAEEMTAEPRRNPTELVRMAWIEMRSQEPPPSGKSN